MPTPRSGGTPGLTTFVAGRYQIGLQDSGSCYLTGARLAYAWRGGGVPLSILYGAPQRASTGLKAGEWPRVLRLSRTTSIYL